MTAVLDRPSPITVMPFLGEVLPPLVDTEQIRAAIYARVSKKNRKGETISVDRQVEVCVGIGSKNEWPVVGQYLDRAKSASRHGTGPRPEFQRLLADMESGAINAVLFWDVDRLIRDGLDLETFMAVADRHGVRLEAHTGPYRPENPHDRMMLRFKGAIAAWESEHRSERVVMAMRDLAEEGHAHGGRRPYGFAAPGYTQHVAEEVAVLREVAERVLEGSSMTAIARDLNDREIPSASGARWSGATLRNCLISPRMAGYRMHVPQRERVRLARAGRGPVLTDPEFDRREMREAKWDAVIDLETWRQLRRILVDPSRRSSGGNVPEHLLSGVIRCHNCHSNLVPKSSKGRATRYVCDARIRANLAKIKDADLATCGGRGIAEEFADTVVATKFLAFLRTPQMFARTRSLQFGAGTEIVSDLAASIAADERQLADLSDLMTKGEMPFSVGAPIAKKIEARIAASRTSITRHRPPDSEIPVFETSEELAEWWNDPAVRITTKRSLLRLAVSHVDLLEAGDRRLDPGRLLVHFDQVQGVR